MDRPPEELGEKSAQSESLTTQGYRCGKREGNDRRNAEIHLIDPIRSGGICLDQGYRKGEDRKRHDHSEEIQNYTDRVNRRINNT